MVRARSSVTLTDELEDAGEQVRALLRRGLSPRPVPAGTAALEGGVRVGQGRVGDGVQ
jgi:hypothetical protein